MNVYRTRQIDNRDSEQMYEYFEARIEVLKRRISDLEKENRVLRVGRPQELHAAVAQHKAVTSKK
jgi:hypothetical protein